MLSGIHHTFAIGGGELNGLDAYSLFVCFVDDRTKTPTSGDEWRGGSALGGADTLL